MGYAITFGTANVIAFVIQSLGAGVVAASLTRTHKNVIIGSKITLEGIIIQMIVITFHILFSTEFFVRYVKNAPVQSSTSSGAAPRGLMDRDLIIVSSALMFSTVCLFIRSIYRTIELGVGWDGRIFKTEVYFTVLDGAMTVLVMYSLNVAHLGGLPRVHAGVSSSESVGMTDVRAAHSEGTQALA